MYQGVVKVYDMQSRAEAETLLVLAAAVVLMLAASVSEGRILSTCELRDQMSMSLPASVLNHITDLAETVCNAELNSGLNTSAIHKITLPHDDDNDSHPTRSDGLRASTIRPSTVPKGRRHKRGTWADSSDESSESEAKRPTPSSADMGGNSTTALKNAKESKSEPTSTATAVLVTAALKKNGSSYEDGRGPRKTRSAKRPEKDDSNESKEKTPIGNIPVTSPRTSTSKPTTATTAVMTSNATTANTTKQPISAASTTASVKQNASSVTSNPAITATATEIITLTANASSPVNGRRRRGARSETNEHENSSEESGKDDVTNVWTLYGVFQLPDRIACSSGNQPSINLCNMTCDSLTDDDLTDDVACVGTILTEVFSMSKNGHFEELFQKFFSVLHQKECSSVVGSQYFSNC